MWRKVLIIIIAALMVGCIAEIDSVATSVDPAGWYSGQPKSLAFTNDDTTALNTMSLIVKYDKRLTNNSLRLNVTVITPDSLTLTEEVKVAVPMRRGDVSRATIAVEPFRRHAHLARTGIYRFEIEPTHPIFGLTGIGIEIKNEKQD